MSRLHPEVPSSTGDDDDDDSLPNGLRRKIVIPCVVCFFLRVPNVPVCFTLNDDPAMVAQDKVTAATSITAGSCPNLGCCDDCNLYANFEALPPCYCNVNEGL